MFGRFERASTLVAPIPHVNQFSGEKSTGSTPAYCMLAFHYMFYNFARIHQSLRVTSGMEAGIAQHVWSLEEISALL